MEVKFDVRLSSESVDIISAGSVIQFKSEDLIFEIEEMKFKLAFKTDDGKPRIDSEVAEDNSELRMNIFNYDSSWGIGVKKPLEVAEIDGKKLFFMIRVYSMGKDKDYRSVHYTWYLEKSNGEMEIS